MKESTGKSWHDFILDMAEQMQVNKVEYSKLKVARVDQWGKAMISRTMAEKNILWIAEKE